MDLLYNGSSDPGMRMAKVNHRELRNHIDVCFAIGVGYSMPFCGVPDDLQSSVNL